MLFRGLMVFRALVRPPRLPPLRPPPPEVGSKSFSDVMAQGKRTWNKQLNRVQAEALDKRTRVLGRAAAEGPGEGVFA